MNSLHLLCEVTKKQPELVLNMNEQLFGFVVDLMRSTDSNIHDKALLFVSVAFTVSCPNLMDLAINKGVFENFHAFTFAAKTESVKIALWGVENITAEDAPQVA